MKLLTLLCATTCVVGKQEFSRRIPNGASVPGYTAIGHTNDKDGARNQFGSDYGSAGGWTVSLCLKDSDGDGQTNGQELGDPCCIWAIGEPPNQTAALSNPGVSTSKRDPTLYNFINCTGITPNTASNMKIWSGTLAIVSILSLLF